MKKLFLIRHAKSSWDDPELDDFDRPLNHRGNNDAHTMGERLKKRGVKPELVYSSGAKRAKSTAELLCKELGCEEKIVFVDELYATTPEDILEIISKTPKHIDTLFVISHNPGLNELASELVEFGENLPTTGILEIWFDTDNWRKVSSAKKELKNFDFPKNL